MENSKVIDPIVEQFNSIQASKNSNKEVKTVKYDKKNYLDVKLPDGVNEKTLTVRLISLAPETETPFREVYMHYLPSAKRSYVCTKKTKKLPEGTNLECPFCDLEQEARTAQKGASDILWEKYKKVVVANMAQLNFVGRVVDRDDEGFGTKFWKFNQANYESIIDIYKNFMKHQINIFDEQNGRDLLITIKRKEGKCKITNISADVVSSPIAKTEEEILKFKNDPKKWNDVYVVKPYEYLSLIIDNKTPWFDNVNKKWVDKAEFEQAKKQAEDEVYETSEEIEETGDDADDLPF